MFLWNNFCVLVLYDPEKHWNKKTFLFLNIYFVIYIFSLIYTVYKDFSAMSDLLASFLRNHHITAGSYPGNL